MNDAAHPVTKTRIRYRKLEEHDIRSDGFRAILESFAEESRLVEETGIPLNLGHFEESFLHLSSVGYAHGFGAFKDGQLVGVILFTLVSHIFTGVIQAQELAWYVLPEHRNGSIAIRLFRRFEQAAKDRGAKLVTMIHLRNSMPEALAKFYKSQGYTETETSYFKSL